MRLTSDSITNEFYISVDLRPAIYIYDMYAM